MWGAAGPCPPSSRVPCGRAAGFLGVLACRGTGALGCQATSIRLGALQAPQVAQTVPAAGAHGEHRQHTAGHRTALSCWLLPPPPQLAFLVLTLTQLCAQLYRVAERGVRSYWRKPGNWLEVGSRVISVTGDSTEVPT